MNKFNEKSRSAYNKKADDYDNTPEGRFTQSFQRLLISAIDLEANTNVLDVACGNGSLLAALSRIAPINGFGIDISDRMIENAAANNPCMTFHTAGCEKIPFGNASMDAITVCAAYHHFPDITAFALEAKRVLKPGGTLHIADVYLPSFLRLILNPFVPLSRAGDVKFYSPKEIVNTFETVRFKAVSVKTSGHIQIISMQKTG